MTAAKFKIGVFFLASISIVMLLSGGVNGITGKSTPPAENLKLHAEATSTSLQGGEWQLREFDYRSDPYNPDINFLMAGDSILEVSSGYASVGMSYVFLQVPRSDLDGKKIQIHWNAYYTYPDDRNLQLLQVHVFDKAFDRACMTDYFQENLDREPARDYTHIQSNTYPGPLGASPGWLGWRTDISGTLNLASWVSDTVTILIQTADAWAMQSVAGDFDWIKILDAANNEIYSFDFSGNVAMEVTGTTHDYGLFNAVEPVSMYIDPPVSQTGINEFFSIDVKVAQITDLYSWEFKIYYLNTILSATDILEGPILKSVGYTLWMDNSNPDYNATHGLIHVGASLTGEIPGVTGSGVIATITFGALVSGSSLLDLEDTIALDSSLAHIQHNVFGGWVNVGQHDVAISSIMLDKSVVGNSSRCAMTINVTVENHGYFAESFSVTLYANSSVINSTAIGLGVSQSATLQFIWRPAGFPKGNYTLGASASVVPGETDVNDNTLYNNRVIAVAIAGDLTGNGGWPDGTVDIGDASLIGLTWGSNRGTLRYQPNCDINNDGIIDIEDVAILGRNWGKIDP